MNKLTRLSVAVLASALLAPAFAQGKPNPDTQVLEASAPGKASVVGVANVTATVEAIDQAKREVTLKGPKGQSVTLVAGPEVRNFDKVKVGDKVVARYVEALTLTLKKGDKQAPARMESADAARSPTGQPPGAAVAQQVEVTADVVAVNAKKRMVTLKGPNHEAELHVQDPEQFKLIKVGDQIEAIYTEALALDLEPTARK
jgi:hypothetical protein